MDRTIPNNMPIQLDIQLSKKKEVQIWGQKMELVCVDHTFQTVTTILTIKQTILFVVLTAAQLWKQTPRNVSLCMVVTVPVSSAKS